MRNESLSLIGSSISQILLPPEQSSSIPLRDNQLVVVGTRLSRSIDGSWMPVVELSGETPLFDFETHTFTNAGASWDVGPTLAQMRTAYSAEPWAANPDFLNAGAATGIQVFTVPKSGEYKFAVRGATRSNFTTGTSQLLDVEGAATLEIGWKVYIIVGQVPQPGAIDSGVYRASGGGGGTFVYCPEFDAERPIIVAGGAGGCSDPARGTATTAGVGSEADKIGAGFYMNGSSLVESPVAFGDSGSAQIIPGTPQGRGSGGGGWSTPSSAQGGNGDSFLIANAMTARSGRGGATLAVTRVALGGFGGGGGACAAATGRAAGGGGGFTGGWSSIQTSGTNAAVGACGGSYRNTKTRLLDQRTVNLTAAAHGFCKVTYSG